MNLLENFHFSTKLNKFHRFIYRFIHYNYALIHTYLARDVIHIRGRILSVYLEPVRLEFSNFQRPQKKAETHRQQQKDAMFTD